MSDRNPITGGPQYPGDAQAIIDAVAALHKHELITLGNNDAGKPVVAAVVPSGMKVESIHAEIEKHRVYPEFRVGTARMLTLDSFIDHVNRFKRAESVVFANTDPNKPRLCAVLDYHQAGVDGKARNGRHRTEHEFPVSDEYKLWSQPREFGQLEFAEFIEERLSDVSDPDLASAGVKAAAEQLFVALASPAKLLELSRGLQVRVDQTAGKNVNLASGEGSVTFTEAHTDGQGELLRIPGAFAIAIPVFRGGPKYALVVRLRYRVGGGKVMWKLVPYRLDLAFRDCIEEACKLVAEKTELPLLYGTPEGHG